MIIEILNCEPDHLHNILMLGGGEMASEELLSITARWPIQARVQVTAECVSLVTTGIIIDDDHLVISGQNLVDARHEVAIDAMHCSDCRTDMMMCTVATIRNRLLLHRGAM